MEGGSLSSDEFPAFSEKVVPFLHITTRIEGHPYDDLLTEKGGTGFPTLMYMDADGAKLGEPEGRDVSDFDAGLAKAADLQKQLTDLRARVAKGDEKAKVGLFLVEFELGMISFEDAKAKAKTLKDLTPEQKKKLKQMLVNGEVNELLAGIRSEETMLEAAAKMKAMLEEGKIPTGDAADNFWSILMEWASRNEDIPVFEKALAALKKKYADNERAKPFFEMQEAKLKEMKEAKEAGHEEVVEEHDGHEGHDG